MTEEKRYPLGHMYEVDAGALFPEDFSVNWPFYPPLHRDRYSELGYLKMIKKGYVVGYPDQPSSAPGTRDE